MRILFHIVAFCLVAQVAGAKSELHECNSVKDGDAKIVKFETTTRAGDRVEILGALMRPADPGPFPAIVLLHRVFGVEKPDCFRAAQQRYRQWGYMSLLVDSNSVARKVRDGYGPTTLTGYDELDQAVDALSAAAYLKALPAVDEESVIIVGHAFGGSAALRATSRSVMATRGDAIDRLKPFPALAVVVWHPACPTELLDIQVPVIIIMGTEDNLNSSRACRAMHAVPIGAAPQPSLQFIQGAGHNFDVAWFTEYDPLATSRAYKMLKSFMERHVPVR